MKDLAELDKIRVPSDAELRRKESLRDQIRRSQQKLDDLRRSDSFLVYVSLVPEPNKPAPSEVSAIWRYLILLSWDSCL